MIIDLGSKVEYVHLLTRLPPYTLVNLVRSLFLFFILGSDQIWKTQAAAATWGFWHDLIKTQSNFHICNPTLANVSTIITWICEVLAFGPFFISIVFYKPLLWKYKTTVVYSLALWFLCCGPWYLFNFFIFSMCYLMWCIIDSPYATWPCITLPSLMLRRLALCHFMVP